MATVARLVPKLPPVGRSCTNHGSPRCGLRAGAVAGGAMSTQSILGPADVPEMLALVELSRSRDRFDRAPSSPGTYIGLRLSGRLVAMAGERLWIGDFREVSAVRRIPMCRAADTRGADTPGDQSDAARGTDADPFMSRREQARESSCLRLAWALHGARNFHRCTPSGSASVASQYGSQVIRARPGPGQSATRDGSIRPSAPCTACRCGRAPSSPRRFFLSASYSW